MPSDIPPPGFKQEPRSSGLFCLWDNLCVIFRMKRLKWYSRFTPVLISINGFFAKEFYIVNQVLFKDMYMFKGIK